LGAFCIGNYLQANNIKLPEDICEKYFGHRWEEGEATYYGERSAWIGVDELSNKN